MNIKKINYDKIDQKIRPLVKILNDIDGVKTKTACEGHKEPSEAMCSFTCDNDKVLELICKDLNWLSGVLLGSLLSYKWRVSVRFYNGDKIYDMECSGNINTFNSKNNRLIVKEKPIYKVHEDIAKLAKSYEILNKYYKKTGSLNVFEMPLVKKKTLNCCEMKDKLIKNNITNVTLIKSSPFLKMNDGSFKHLNYINEGDIVYDSGVITSINNYTISIKEPIKE